MKKIIILTVFALLGSLFVQAQVTNAPNIICVTNDIANNNVDLKWTVPDNPCGPFNRYIIYSSTSSSGPFTPVDTVFTQTDTCFTDTGALIGIGSNDLYYYVEVLHDCPTPMASPASAIVANIAPDRPVINSVSVENGVAVINWQQSVSPQTCFYVIYYDLTPVQIADTVWGISNITYTDNTPLFDPNNSPVSYFVRAFDCCGNNENSLPSRITHTTIFQQTTVNRCEANIRITWTGYGGWGNDLTGYEIYASINGVPETLVGTEDTLAREFTFDAFNDGDSICFRVRAINSNPAIISNSNEICLIAAIVQPPNNLFIKNVTVSGNDINVFWIVDTTSEITDYELLSDADSSTMLALYDFPVPNPLKGFDDTTDNVSNPNRNSYFYRLIAVDSCANKYPSTYGRTMFLEVELTNFFTNELKWNAFELEYATISQYNIYRDFGSGFTYLATVSSNTFEYEDDITAFFQEEGNFCYYIEAEFNLSLPSGFIENNTSLSNTACQTHRPVFHIPNAIVPNGTNNEFKPVVFFGDLRNYQMIVFNRWGQEIFETNDINQGWDGTHKTKEVPLGGYPYVIKFTSVDGIPIEQTGIVMVIK